MDFKRNFEIGNDALELKKVSGELLHVLKEKQVSEEIIFDVHVSLEEALRNAMMHGNKEIDGKKVVVLIEVNDNVVRVSVEDEGEGFDINKVPDPTSEENLLKESGRGVYLIKHLMDRVDYLNGGRKVIMEKNITNGRHNADNKK